MMKPLADEGIRVHRVDNLDDKKPVVGETATALCGVEWEVTITDPDKLSELPDCYGCINVLAVDAFARYMLLEKRLTEFETQKIKA